MMSVAEASIHASCSSATESVKALMAIFTVPLQEVVDEFNCTSSELLLMENKKARVHMHEPALTPFTPWRIP